MNSFINMQMPGPRAVQNLQMPHPWDSQGGQMPCSGSLGGGGLGAAGIDWGITRPYSLWNLNWSRKLLVSTSQNQCFVSDKYVLQTLHLLLQTTKRNFENC